MMIRITQRCTMGCTHCMNSAVATGNEMSLQTFDDALKFLRNNRLGQFLVITGGEPTEHSEFDAFMMHLIQFCRKYKCFKVVGITTNGEQIAKNPDRFIKFVEDSRGAVELTFQVSADKRYYPRRVEPHKRVFHQKGFIYIDNCVEQIYPQGRARDNGFQWSAKASKCYNVRAISHQMPCSLHEIVSILESKMKFCTPVIDTEGNIKLGESDLCPAASSIYNPMKQIMEDIRRFKCSGCDMINDLLPPFYKQLL